LTARETGGLSLSFRLLNTLRPPFLLLGPVCVFLGLALVVAGGRPVDFLVCAMILMGAVCAHASVNAFNEFADFHSGLDLVTHRTPFSGGSGTLPENPAWAPKVLGLAWGGLVLTALTGLWLVWRSGPGLLPVGLAGMALIYFYSGPINRNPWLCLLAPGLGFGPLMVLGSAYAATGSFLVSPAAASVVPLLLVSDLLLLNQFPDLDADRQAGRRHLVVVLGRSRSARVYVALLAVAYLWLAAAVGLSLLPPAALLGFLTLPAAAAAAHGVLSHAEDPPRLLPSMALNVAVNLLTPLLMGLGAILSR
jgi:1,4-dihydroxy-2-naphthoate polyprenyltransferase